ncbi:MAG: hypothetical protein JSR91_21150 [Proteobacteria bacterium]|nr:hypothetical protein [Pseudomonadota bacterium]
MIDESHFPPGLPYPDEETWKAYRQQLIDELIDKEFDGSAWIDLCAHLAWAAELDRKTVGAKSRDDRIAVRYALRRVIVYLERSEFILKCGGSDLLKRLYLALGDLDSGKVVAVVKPPRRVNPGHSVPDPIIALAARTMDELVKAGESRLKAASRVAKAINARHPKVAARTVARWREGCKEGPGPGARVSAKAIAQFHAPLPTGVVNDPELLLEALQKSLL